ncbi:hypothetical protein C8R43DRAFT_956061 [Mycena crocata]|nr:hypothetical protein C8R43DRAFT_956061 [Mycena crocata]
MWNRNDRPLSENDDLGTWIAGLFELRAAGRAARIDAGSASVNSASTSASAASQGANTAPTSTSTNTVSAPALAPKTLATLRDASFTAFDGWDAGVIETGIAG